MGVGREDGAGAGVFFERLSTMDAGLSVRNKQGLCLAAVEEGGVGLARGVFDITGFFCLEEEVVGAGKAGKLASPRSTVETAGATGEKDGVGVARGVSCSCISVITEEGVATGNAEKVGVEGLAAGLAMIAG